MVAPGEGTGGRATDGALGYTGYGVDAGIGISNQSDVDGKGRLRVWTVGGSYKWDPVKLFVGFTRDKNTTADTATATGPALAYRLVNVGMQYQVTPLTILVGQVVRIGDESTNAAGRRDGTA